MADHNTTDAVSRRNVLKTAGGLLAGATMLAGLGAGRGAAATEEGLQFEIEEANEEVIITEVFIRWPANWTPREMPEAYHLGHVDQFGIDEDTVRLPEDTDGLATPAEVERLDEETYGMYFRTADIDFSEMEDEEVTLGLGVFPERTVPREYFDTYSTGGPMIQ